MPSRFCCVLAALVVVALVAHGDDALRRDGTRVTGRLELFKAGRFRFHVGDRTEPVVGLDRVRFTPRPTPPPAVALWHQIHLARGQSILAEVRFVDDKALHVRPAWVKEVAVPRMAVERVTSEPGWQPVAVGGTATELKPPLATGRVGVVFRAADTTRPRVRLDLGFVRDGKPNPVGIDLVGPDERFTVTATDKPDVEGRLKRDGQTHRLSAEFDRDRLAIFVDDLVLWVRDAGPGELRTVRLVSAGNGPAAEGLVVERSQSSDPPRAWADLTADAVRAPNGDETYGTLTAAGPAGVSLRRKDRTLVLGWHAVAGLGFQRGPVAEKPTTGEHVRVRVRTADGLYDVLDGAVRALDDRALILDHAVLGELTIPRDRLAEIRLQFHGRRLPVETTPHHLGIRPAFGFAVPKPERPQLSRTVALTDPAAGVVVIDAAHVGRTGTPAEVRVNGEVVGELTRLAGRSGPEVRSYRLAVPVRAWRRGDNEIEIRLRPTGGGRVTGIDLRAVRVELADPR